MARDIDEQLTKYLTDAHSIEVQALAQLRTAPDLAGAPVLAQAFRAHLAETEEHERLTRELLERRDAEPSKVKDAVMGVGGKGFLLFARLQPDTPGKLFAHALSYEGLEFASYALLRRVAERAGDEDVAGAARCIGGEERAMMETLESHVDAAVSAALEAHPRDELPTLVKKYLADAHAIEEQAIGLLERAPKIVDEAGLEAVFDDHLSETREHAELVQSRLTALGGDSSSLKDAAMRLGALNWGTFFRGASGHTRQARRLCVCVRASRDRRLRAAEVRRGHRRRYRDGSRRRDDPPRGAERSASAHRHVRHGRRRVAARSRRLGLTA